MLVELLSLIKSGQLGASIPVVTHYCNFVTIQSLYRTSLRVDAYSKYTCLTIHPQSQDESAHNTGAILSIHRPMSNKTELCDVDELRACMMQDKIEEEDPTKSTERITHEWSISLVACIAFDCVNMSTLSTRWKCLLVRFRFKMRKHCRTPTTTKTRYDGASSVNIRSVGSYHTKTRSQSILSS